MDIAGAAYIRDQDKIEKRVAVDGESDASTSSAGHPTQDKFKKHIHIWFVNFHLRIWINDHESWSVISPSIQNRDDSGSVLGYTQENRLREIEVLVGRLAPASRRAEIGGGDGDGPGDAILRGIHAH